jgi:hypothetical protein
LETRPVHWTDEAITPARKSLDKPGIVSFVSQGESDLGNGCIERVVKIDKSVFGPDSAAKFLSRDQGSGPFQQDGTDLKGLALQGHLHPILAQFRSLQIRFKDPETNNFCGIVDVGHKQAPDCELEL